MLYHFLINSQSLKKGEWRNTACKSDHLVLTFRKKEFSNWCFILFFPYFTGKRSFSHIFSQHVLHCKMLQLQTPVNAFYSTHCCWADSERGQVWRRRSFVTSGFWWGRRKIKEKAKKVAFRSVLSLFYVQHAPPPHTHPCLLCPCHFKCLTNHIKLVAQWTEKFHWGVFFIEPWTWH